MQLIINSFKNFSLTRFFPLTFSKIPDISLTVVKFPDISRFFRQVVTLVVVCCLCTWHQSLTATWRNNTEHLVMFMKFCHTLPVSLLFIIAFCLQLFYLFHHTHVHLFQISDCFLKCSMKAQWIKVFNIPRTTSRPPCQTFHKFINIKRILQTTEHHSNIKTTLSSQ